jgi:hypothetical protein
VRIHKTYGQDAIQVITGDPAGWRTTSAASARTADHRHASGVDSDARSVCGENARSSRSPYCSAAGAVQVNGGMEEGVVGVEG